MGPTASSSSVLQWKHRSPSFSAYAGLASSSVKTGVHRRPHSSASSRQSTSSSGASEGDTAVTAWARSPSTSLATYARNAESAPPLNATTTRSSSRSRARSAASSGIDDLDPDALVALALRLGLDDADAADLGRARDVRAAVGLLVEADDVDDADLGHRLRDHVHLRPDQVLVLDGGLAREEQDLDRAIGRELLVHAALDRLAEALGQRIELEVHACRQRLHV